MAKTYEELTSQAETIRTNVLPESNTADLVGQMLKDMVDKGEEQDRHISRVEKKASEVNDKVDNLYIPHLVTMSETEYENLATKEEDTYYMLTEDESL
ncbi:hypothetical protein [Prevotella sp.]|uniref:hypothetical protein n=1 Tax=Prevotella sp. TaxID=59823 RepID=UPI002ABD3FEC|nr:hypothetical protein [Prevotella sp.]